VPDDEHIGHDCHVRVWNALSSPYGAGTRGVRHDMKNERLFTIVHLPGDQGMRFDLYENFEKRWEFNSFTINDSLLPSL
jgi:hypothetical protein